MNPSYTCGACHWSVHLLYIMVKQGSCSWNIQFQLKLIDLFKCLCCPTYVVLQDTRQQQPGWPHDSFTNLKTEHFKTSSFFKVLFKSCLNYHAFSINLAGTKISCIVFIKITRESVDMIDIKQNVQSVVLQYYELFSPKNISHGKKKKWSCRNYSNYLYWIYRIDWVDCNREHGEVRGERGLKRQEELMKQHERIEQKRGSQKVGRRWLCVYGLVSDNFWV